MERCSSRSRGSTARGSRRRQGSSALASRRTGCEVVATREPGGTDLGERLRDLVLHGGHVSPWAEALLYAAARAQHVDEVIRPALDRGAVVICDRYVDSSVAYQGVGRELGLERVLDVNLSAVGGLLPDRTFLLELDAAEICSRLHGEHDRLERESEDFHARVADGYQGAGRALPGADRRPRRDTTRRRARGGGVWSPSRPYLSSPRRSGSSLPR